MSINVKPKEQPMMGDHEIQIIDQLLDWLKPRRCLEFGSGNSTIYFPKKHKFIKQWVSIEHDGHYAKYANKKADKERVVVVWVSNDYWYTDCVRHHKNKYDFIFIDGSFREGCLETAMDLIKKNGIILLHDTGRKEYHVWMKKYKYQLLCEGEQFQSVTGDYAHRGLVLYQKCLK